MRYCSKCGRPLKDDQLYCPKCGHKEPFLKNDEQSSWKSFDSTSKASKNVNYDFTRPTQNQPVKVVPKNVGLEVLAKATRIYEIVIGVFFIVLTIVSVVAEKQGQLAIRIMSIVGIALAGIDVLLTIAIILTACLTKSNGPKHKNAYITTGILKGLILGLAIGQYFLVKSIGFSPMGFMIGVMCLASNAALSSVHSLKKTVIK